MGSHDAEDMYGLQGGLGIGGVVLDNTQALRYQLARTVLEVPMPGEIKGSRCKADAVPPL